MHNEYNIWKKTPEKHAIPRKAKFDSKKEEKKKKLMNLIEKRRKNSKQAEG